MDYKHPFTANLFANQPAKKILLFASGLLLLWLLMGGLFTQSANTARPVFAAADTAETAGPTRSGIQSRAEPKSEGNGWGMWAGFLLLSGGIAGAAYVYRTNESSSPRRKRVLEQLETLPLDKNQRLYLVRCGDEVHLLGTSDQQVALIKTYSADGLNVDVEAHEQTSTGRSFPSVLKQQTPPST